VRRELDGERLGERVPRVIDAARDHADGAAADIRCIVTLLFRAMNGEPPHIVKVNSRSTGASSQQSS